MRAFVESHSHTTLGALFIYLTDGVDAVRDKVAAVIAAQSPENSERTYQLLVHILHIHTSRHSTPASLFRDVLERAIAAFPNNTIFLSMYLWHESRTRISGRIQSLITRLTAEEAGIVPLLWSVWAEAQSSRLFWEGSGAERVRRALDRGINSKS